MHGQKKHPHGLQHPYWGHFAVNNTVWFALSQGLKPLLSDQTLPRTPIMIIMIYHELRW